MEKNFPRSDLLGCFSPSTAMQDVDCLLGLAGQTSPYQPVDIARAFRVTGSSIHLLFSGTQGCGRQKLSILITKVSLFPWSRETSLRSTRVEWPLTCRELNWLISLSFLGLMCGTFPLLKFISALLQEKIIFMLDKQQKSILWTWLFSIGVCST